MKFDYCVGNPPYHYETGRRKIPLYNKFIMELTGDTSISNKVCLITPDGFVKGGLNLEPCRRQMINDKHLKSVEFHQDAVFNGASVKAAITCFDNTQTFDEVNETIVYEDLHKENKTLDWYYRDVIINELKYKVLQLFETKVACKNNMSLPPRGYFAIITKSFKQNRNKFYIERERSEQLKCLINEDGHEYYYVNPEDKFETEGGDNRYDYLDLTNKQKYKMAFAKAGTVDFKPVATYILEPDVIHTLKYLSFLFDTREEAVNCQKYFNCKFFRAGLASKMTSWNLTNHFFENIPIQDFTNNSDIDWSKSSHEIDLQLYKKYNFTEEEIQAIEEYIK